MTLLDWSILVVWLGVALCGFWKGAVRIVFGVGGVVAGVALAVVAGETAAASLVALIGNQMVADVVARVAVFLCCMTLMVAAGWGLEKTLESLRLGWLNRAFGAALAGSVAVVVMAVLLILAARSSPTWAELCDRALLVPLFFRVVELVSSR